MDQDKRDKKVAQETTQKILTLLGFSQTEIKIQTDEQGTVILNIELPEEESGILIGFHGETIYAFQFLLNQILNKKLGYWPRIVLDVANYRQRREQALTKLALDLAEKTKTTGKDQVLNNLNSAERRIIHLTLSKDEQVSTFSEGEDRQRRLIIQKADAQTEPPIPVDESPHAASEENKTPSPPKAQT